jgi:peptide/nickel transport system substrate-binding protein
LTVAGFADIPHRDVHQTVQEALISLGPGLAYSRLLRLRSDPDLDQPSLLLECDLCQSWRLTPEFAYEFQLRPDVRWQNISPVNGRALVADDLVYSYERLRTPGWPNASLFSSIGEIEAPGPHSLRVTLASADADALLSLADGHGKIVAREVVEQHQDLRDGPVIGTGAWLWEGTETGVGTTLSRNPDYFETGLPFLDELAIKVIKPLGAGRIADRERLAAFQGGTVDVVLLPPPEWQALEAAGADVGSVLTRQAGTGVMLAINVRTPVFRGLEMRHAVFRAMDPWDYVDTLWSGQGFVSLGIPVQGPQWLLDRAEMRNGYFGDPGVAREMLAASGLSAPVDVELTVRNQESGDIYLELEQRVVDDLRAVGFNPTIRRLNPAQFSETVFDYKDYQVALGVLPPTSTTNSFLLALLHSSGRWNIAGHEDGLLDGMIERQAAEFDPDRRGVQLQDIQRHVLDQAYLFSPITGTSRWVFKPGLMGFHPNTTLSEYNYWSRTWLDR